MEKTNIVTVYTNNEEFIGNFAYPVTYCKGDIRVDLEINEGLESGSFWFSVSSDSFFLAVHS